ncbi:MAG TPA: hypothetical protein VLC53_17105, partial [Myxococcota bacterium]|nr:hypothetical protein [Myxococcota bacterium]
MASPVAVAPLPPTLAGTGLYQPGSVSVLGADVLAFTPQYPLWSDGSAKRRWLYLPPGAVIDATRPDAWEWPVGTRVWKEFAHGRAIETRFIERVSDGSWRFASYAWNAQGTEARLVPEEGIYGLAAEGAPGGRYAIPSRTDCLACHEGPAVPLLGLTALQLSPDRDPLAPHAQPIRPQHATLATLAAAGRIRGLPDALVETPPRIAAPTPTARAALGYLHGNCGHCHNDGALAGVELTLAQEAAHPDRSYRATLAGLVGRDSRFRPRGAAAAERVVPGHAAS